MLSNPTCTATDQALAGSFARWVEWTDEVAEMREKLEKAMRSCFVRAQISSFRTWRDVVSVEVGLWKLNSVDPQLERRLVSTLETVM